VELDLIISFIQEWGLEISLVSLLMLITSFVAASFVIVRIPVDYFTHHEPQHIFPPSDNPITHIILKCVRNIIGVILLLLGIIMLFTPGQGLLSILLGLICMDFPGKQTLERRIISNPLIFAGINKLRHKLDQPPLQQPNDESSH
jgi:hypothetical protein